eukprot:1820230-Pleurochrysis_carterae.AAC.6
MREGTVRPRTTHSHMAFGTHGTADERMARAIRGRVTKDRDGHDTLAKIECTCSTCRLDRRETYMHAAACAQARRRQVCARLQGD